ncbi:dTDP-4-dehydrorhamnose reductase [Alkalilimnicola ehrlichii]|uniref:dTDP-4-dehydrorhamnose reductase n=1 Tax=Alkalilimnicola ehrlichii TaxID=351052 RepID=A0A3E0WWT9_9GAMM|nr:dTDP-4-dehydrorhamnose reductase [Alkalilimnicola ehrlichii]RFA29334.1 dTDP-4-dehydrorhamnose reductase [Alkalilimnicola ehrlichii]RFA36849.1 dTDP-4-dehydrorhamnose reductase [Alkalilimnicola ehrlichii]
MSVRPRILLTGGSGQVGWELRRSLLALGEVIEPDRERYDLCRPERLARLIRDLKPRWVVNPAAYTAVDKAESEPERCQRINAIAPAVLAEAAHAVGAGFIHFSTDYVFDGAKHSPYTEDDPTAPLNWYGTTKLEGEQAVADVSRDGAWLVLRTGWVYGGRGHNFVRTMQRLMSEKTQLTVVDDQIGAPTWARSIADVAAQVLAYCQSPSAMAEYAGVYHVSCAGATSWYGFASRIRDRLLAAGMEAVAELSPTDSAGYPTPAARSPYSVLDNSKLARRFGLVLPPWEEAFMLAAPEFGL